MSNFIPGPWSVSELKGDVRLICRSNDTSSYPIAKVLIDPTNRFGTGNTDTTARLIAAAPDMLQTLAAIVAQVESHYVEGVPEWARQIAQDALKAVNAATGGDE